jgi:hypothetical protein
MSALGKIIKVIAGKLSTTPKQMKAGGHSGRTASEIVRSKKNESKRTGDKFRREGAAGYFRAKSKQEQAGGTSKTNWTTQS